MVILLNGAFGIGKTTIGRALQRALPGSIIFDPERIGYVLQRLPQWLAPWWHRGLSRHAGLAGSHDPRHSSSATGSANGHCPYGVLEPRHTAQPAIDRDDRRDPSEVIEQPRLVHNLDTMATQPVSHGKAATLGYLATDYARHLEHHLAQIQRLAIE